MGKLRTNSGVQVSLGGRASYLRGRK